MTSFPRFLPVAVVVLSAVVGCPSSDVTPPVAAVRGVSVGPTGSTVKIGSTLQMTAAVTADAGVATTVAWSSPSPGEQLQRPVHRVRRIGVPSDQLLPADRSRGRLGE